VDWSGHLFRVRRTEYILLSNTRSLYSVLMFGKGITGRGRFIDRGLESIRETLQLDGLESAFQRFIVPAWKNVAFARALNRSVTGSMNELVYTACVWLEEEECSLVEAASRLNNTLLSMLGGLTGTGYGKPREAFQALSADGRRFGEGA
jgi:hypothetical protein